MLKRFLQVFIVVFVVCSAVSVFAYEIKEIARQNRVRSDVPEDSQDRILCVDGLQVFQTIAFGAGKGNGVAISNLQLYEEKNGKVVPATCK